MVAPITPFGLASTLVYASCVLGHVFSPYLHFHGGKGISVGFGAGLGMYWPVGVGLLVVFLLFAVPSRYVSLGSVCAAASLPVICLALGFGPLNTLPMAIVAVVVIWSHRQNIESSPATRSAGSPSARARGDGHPAGRGHRDGLLAPLPQVFSPGTALTSRSWRAPKPSQTPSTRRTGTRATCGATCSPTTWGPPPRPRGR